jgi:radical SAM protein with 4Fe4S-binding SPASM domain
MRYARKILNRIGIEFSFRLRWAKTAFFPVKITIEPNNDCNFKCPQCQLPYSNKKPVHMSLHSLKEVIGQFPNLSHIVLQGLGEPLLNNDLVGMLRFGEGLGIHMEFTTNGSLLDKKTAVELAKLRNTTILFSLDGASSETFEKMRPGSNFGKIVDNVAYLSALRSAGVAPGLEARVLVTRHNAFEIPEIVVLAKRLGLDSVHLQVGLSDWGRGKAFKCVDSIKVDQEAHSVKVALEEGRKVARSCGIGIHVYYNGYANRKRCNWPWSSTFIASNGDVVPCCVIADATVVKLGNLFETSFEDIWNSQAYQALRRKIAYGDVPAYCKRCYR